MTRRRYRKAVQTALPAAHPKQDRRSAKPLSTPREKAISRALTFGVLAAMILVVLRSLTSATWPLITAPIIGLVTAGIIFASHVGAARSIRRYLPRRTVKPPFDQGELPVSPIAESTEPVDISPVSIQSIERQQRQREVADWHFFLRETYNSHQTSRRFWVGQRLPSGHTMKRDRWKEYTERLRLAGLASRRHMNARLELHGDYRQALEVFRKTL